MAYYHVSFQESLKRIKPSGFYERVNKDGELSYWYPVTNSPPVFPISNIPETSFATTIEGALFGVCSNGDCVEREYYVYSTDEKPDVDLTDEMVADFGVIEEVRYRREINVTEHCHFVLPKKMIDKINKCYWRSSEDGDVFFADECGDVAKKELRNWLDKSTTCKQD